MQRLVRYQPENEPKLSKFISMNAGEIYPLKCRTRFFGPTRHKSPSYKFRLRGLETQTREQKVKKETFSKVFEIKQ